MTQTTNKATTANETAIQINIGDVFHRTGIVEQTCIILNNIDGLICWTGSIKPQYLPKHEFLQLFDKATEKQTTAFFDALRDKKSLQWNSKQARFVRWKPKVGETYWKINEYGDTVDCVFKNTEKHIKVCNALNCFPNIVLASKYTEAQLQFNVNYTF